MLQARLKDWQTWGLEAEPRLVRTFTAGKNHQTALIESAAKQYVLKIFNGPSEIAIQAQQWAGQLGLSPAIIYAEEQLAIMALVHDSGESEQSISSVAKSLCVLHNAPEPQWPRFNLLSFCDQYLANAATHIQQWHTELLPGLQLFVADTTSWCACHNDLVRENCLFDGKQIQLIDWEFAMLNNPWFDLAAVIFYFELDQQQTKQFLSSYREGWELKVDEAIVQAAKLAVLWCDLLWHVNKYGSEYTSQNSARFEQLRSIAATLSIRLPE